MTPRALILASTLTAAVGGKNMIQWQTQCTALLKSFVGRSAFEVAAVCRSKIPTDICREASQDLGAQPWAPGKLVSTCQKWEKLWAPRVRSKSRNLGDSISDKLMPTANCTTVDPTTGVKILTSSPWKPQPAGINAFAVPIYMLSSSLQEEPYVPPGPQVELVARADTTPPPNGNMVNGTLQVTWADGAASEDHEKTLGAFAVTIAEIAGVKEEAVSITRVSVDGSSAYVRYTIGCPSYISTVTTSHNLVFSNKSRYEDVLSERFGQHLILQHSFVQDAYGGKHLRPAVRAKPPSAPAGLGLLQHQRDLYAMAATGFARGAELSLPAAIPPEAVLGSVRLTVADVSAVSSDLALQRALTAEVASVASVQASRLLVTSVQLTPTISRRGSVSPEGEVQMFFAVNTTDTARAAGISGSVQEGSAAELTHRVRKALAAAGAKSHGLTVESLGARIAADMQPSRKARAAFAAVAAAEAKWAATGQRTPAITLPAAATAAPARAALLALSVALLLAGSAALLARRWSLRAARGRTLLSARHLAAGAAWGEELE